MTTSSSTSVVTALQRLFVGLSARTLTVTFIYTHFKPSVRPSRSFRQYGPWGRYSPSMISSVESLCQQCHKAPEAAQRHNVIYIRYVSKFEALYRTFAAPGGVGGPSVKSSQHDRPRASVARGYGNFFPLLAFGDITAVGHFFLAISWRQTPVCRIVFGPQTGPQCCPHFF